MTDFERLVETSPHPLTRELLSAGLEDAPAASSAPRVAAALGLSLGVAATPALAAPALGAAGVAGQTAAVGVSSIAKWLGAGLLAGTVVSGGAALVQSTPAAGERAPVTAAVPPAPPAPLRATPTHRPAGAPVATTTALALETPRAAPSARRAVAAAPLASAPAVAALPDSSGALALEVARIDEVRVALRSGDAQGALTGLERYDAERQTGVLDREAAVLRIEALRRAGRSDEARAHARRYLDRYPSDAHATSLRKLVGELDAAEGIDR